MHPLLPGHSVPVGERDAQILPSLQRGTECLTAGQTPAMRSEM